ncbi:MAG: hypothetical protein ACRDBG_25900 [Waterburya sp.]
MKIAAINEQLTVEHIDEILKTKVIKGELLQSLLGTKRLIKRGIAIYNKPETSYFIACNKIFVNGIDDNEIELELL